MIQHVERQQLSKSKRLYYGVMGVIFIASNTIALSLFVKVLCAIIGIEIQRLFYWAGVALLSIFTYPKFRQARSVNKHVMLFISAVFLIISILMVTLI